jgi:hypothetical protein
MYASNSCISMGVFPMTSAFLLKRKLYPTSFPERAALSRYSGYRRMSSKARSARHVTVAFTRVSACAINTANRKLRLDSEAIVSRTSCRFARRAID